LWAPTWRPHCTVSHELLNSKHKGSSLAGIARSAAFGQMGSRVGDVLGGSSVAVAIVRSDAAEITKALAGDLLAFRAGGYLFESG